MELEGAATVSPHLAERLVGAVTTAPGRGATVVVADRVVAKARDVLRDAGWGWLDRRGHLRIVARGVLVDTTIPALAESRGLPEAPLRRRVAREVAAALLLAPGEVRDVRDLAGELGRAASSVSEAHARAACAGIDRRRRSARRFRVVLGAGGALADHRAGLAAAATRSRRGRR